MKREPRWIFVAYCAGLGVIIGGAFLIGGEPVMAGVALAIMIVFGVLMSLTPFGTLKPSSRDEREEKIDTAAAVATLGVLILAIIAGWLWDVTQGGDGTPYVWLAALGGATYLASLAVMNRVH